MTKELKDKVQLSYKRAFEKLAPEGHQGAPNKDCPSIDFPRSMFKEGKRIEFDLKGLKLSSETAAEVKSMFSGKSKADREVHAHRLFSNWHIPRLQSPLRLVRLILINVNCRFRLLKCFRCEKRHFEQLLFTNCMPGL